MTDSTSVSQQSQFLDLLEHIKTLPVELQIMAFEELIPACTREDTSEIVLYLGFGVGSRISLLIQSEQFRNDAGLRLALNRPGLAMRIVCPFIFNSDRKSDLTRLDPYFLLQRIKLCPKHLIFDIQYRKTLKILHERDVPEAKQHMANMVEMFRRYVADPARNNVTKVTLRLGLNDMYREMDFPEKFLDQGEPCHLAKVFLQGIVDSAGPALSRVEVYMEMGSWQWCKPAVWAEMILTATRAEQQKTEPSSPNAKWALRIVEPTGHDGLPYTTNDFDDISSIQDWPSARLRYSLSAYLGQYL